MLVRCSNCGSVNRLEDPVDQVGVVTKGKEFCEEIENLKTLSAFAKIARKPALIANCLRCPEVFVKPTVAFPKTGELCDDCPWTVVLTMKTGEWRKW